MNSHTFAGYCPGSGAVVVFKFPHPADVYLNILPALLLFAGLLRVTIASTTGALVSKGHDPSHPSSKGEKIGLLSF